MGLAGRKQKQRIPADPRNLSWADDASRFGLSYLSKFGWDASKGLGSSGDGIKSHLKVSQKLDMMGIGAQHQRDPNGIAWKQNQEFEALLKRLNEGVEGEEGTEGMVEGKDEGEGEEMEGGSLRTDGEKEDPALVAREGEQADQTPDNMDQPSNEKKRKRKAADGADSREQRKKKRKQEKYKKTDSDPSENVIPGTFDRKGASPPREAVPEQPKPKARPMAHRARIQAAKRLATKSAAAISEILGIAPTPSSSSTSMFPSSSPSTASTPGSLTPLDPTPSLPLEKLTTSSKSVADYFKDKLGSKSSSSTSGSGFTTPGLGHVARTAITAQVDTTIDNYADMHAGTPRRGLGSARLLATHPPSSDNQPCTAPGLGSARNSNFMLTSFLKTPATSYTPVPLAQIPPDSGAGSAQANSGTDELTEKEREKVQRREERRRRREAAAKEPEEVTVTKEGMDNGSGERKKRKSEIKKIEKEDKESKRREKKMDHTEHIDQSHPLTSPDNSNRPPDSTTHKKPKKDRKRHSES